jgi:lysyl-tRNA synthetase class 2
VPSTAIKSFRYDPDRKELYVTFTSGGSYTYFNVPQDVYDGWQTAFSKGTYFRDHILGKLEYARRK